MNSLCTSPMFLDVKCELLTWEDVYEYNRVLAGKIRQSKFKPDVIVAVAPNGFVPARALTDFLFVEDLRSLDLNRHALHGPSLKGKKVLVVDDLVNTGASVGSAVDLVKTFQPASVKTACLFLLEGASFKPDFFTAKKQRKWFVFPWRFLNDVTQLVASLFPRGSHPKSLDMINEELNASFDFKLPRPKLLEVLKELRERGVVRPYFYKNGKLLRWQNAQTKKKPAERASA